MVFRRKEYPEIGEYVIATAVKLEGHGVYVALDEYEKRGYIPIGEVASTWVKNIKDFIKEGQKLVLKVIRIDDRRGHIDLSLRKVTEREKKEKLIQYKKSKKAEKLFEGTAKVLGVELNDAIRAVGIPLEDRFGDLYSALEAAAINGPSVLRRAGIDERWSEALHQTAKEHVEAPTVVVAAMIQLSTSRPRGVEDIKKAIAEGEKVAKKADSKVAITYVGAPRYRIEVSAKDYKSAEDALKEVSGAIISKLSSEGGSGALIR